MRRYSLKKCYYCGKLGLEKGDRLILEKTDAKTLIKIEAASCTQCIQKKRLQITLDNLSLVSNIPFEKLKNYTSISNSFLAITKNFSTIPDSEKKEMAIGLVDRHTCMICWELIKLGQQMVDHNAELHSEEQIVKCSFGCGSFYLESDMEMHERKCCIFCPVCMSYFREDTGHFSSVHPCVLCPFLGCATAFQIKRDEHEEDDENGINDFLKHMMTSHMWKINLFADTGSN